MSKNDIVKLFDIPREVINDNERQRRVYSVEGIAPTVLARTDQAKVLIKEVKPMELTGNDIIRIISKHMDYPCTYGFGDLDVSEYMIHHNGDWCEENCPIGSTDECEKCWRKFFETLAEDKEM